MNKEAILKFADVYVAAFPTKNDLSDICRIISKSKKNDNPEDQFMLFGATLLQDKIEQSLDYLEHLIEFSDEKLKATFPEIDYLKNASLVLRSFRKPSERNQIRVIRMINKVIRVYALSVNRFI
tara:strand:- start:597 stop:968 length:372 start_codon:yes stop_codon:yes gene_type:complete